MEEQQSQQSQQLSVQVMPNGPLEVTGPLKIALPDGTEKEEPGPAYLCRCGGSANKPYCDGTHLKNGFKG